MVTKRESFFKEIRGSSLGDIIYGLTLGGEIEVWIFFCIKH